MGPTCDNNAHPLINLSFIQELKETEPRLVLLFYTIFFLDRSQNYESNGVGFKIFGALDN
jgi:hypothetical protein